MYASFVVRIPQVIPIFLFDIPHIVCPFIYFKMRTSSALTIVEDETELIKIRMRGVWVAEFGAECIACNAECNCARLLILSLHYLFMNENRADPKSDRTWPTSKLGNTIHRRHNCWRDV